MSNITFVAFCPQCLGNRTFDRGGVCQSCGDVLPAFAPKVPKRVSGREIDELVDNLRGGVYVHEALAALERAEEWMSDSFGEDGLHDPITK